MKVIDKVLLDETSRKARVSERGRMNHNFHERLDDPVNRLLNALEPGTFLPVHRHVDKDEAVLVLRGPIPSFVFDEAGAIVQHVVADPREGVYGFDIPAGTWHGLLVLASGTVVYEVKPGPYRALGAEDIAPWSPPADDPQAVQAFLDRLAQECRS
mgnify:CR=1 FL=1